MELTNRLAKTLLGAGLAVALGFAITDGNPAAAQSWTEITPVDDPGTTTDDPPLVRSAHTAVYDPATNQMIVFGGRGATHLNDVWHLSTANGLGPPPAWTQPTTSGGPPQARFAHMASYDQAHDRMIVFGGGFGSSSPCANDVWVLSNASGAGGTPTWTQLSPTGGPPALRFAHSQVYDPDSNKLIVFGGSNCFTSPSFGDVWVLSNANGLGGTPVWTQLFPSPSTPNRSGHSTVYDAVNNSMIVYGGDNSLPAQGGPLDDEVWVLSDADNSGGSPAWTQLFPSGTPPAARVGHSAVYDAAANKMIVFGGQVSTLDPFQGNDVWVLSNANGLGGGTPAWTELSPSGTLPNIRGGHSAVFDPASNRMIVFGGGHGAGNNLNDVWVLSLTVFSCAWGGFEPPFDVTLTLKRKTKRAIPVQMVLEDDSGAIITDADVAAAPVVNVTFSPAGGGGGDVPVTDNLLPLGQANDDNMFRFDTDELKWIYNLGSKPFDAPGTYTVTAVAGDVSYTIDSSCTGTFVRLD
ncbi:MAG: hypothetical protein IH904_07690 [Proteobacteria bacterium]|nr:hypothetical protein [Pseudomonadota bacterium]